MHKRLVIDSSVIVKWIHQENESHLTQSDQILIDAHKKGFELFAPELAKYEVANALVYGKKLTPKEAEIPIKALFSTPLRFFTFTFKETLETYKIATNNKITFYDASFVALAKEKDAILVTDNPKHQGKIKEVKVVALKDYE